MQIVFGSNCKLAPARGNASSQTKRQRPDCKQLHVRWACFSIYPVYRHRTALLRLVILWSCGTMSSRWWWSFYICIMFLLHWVFCLWISYFFTLLIWIMICRFVSPPLGPDLIQQQCDGLRWHTVKSIHGRQMEQSNLFNQWLLRQQTLQSQTESVCYMQQRVRTRDQQDDGGGIVVATKQKRKSAYFAISQILTQCK